MIPTSFPPALLLADLLVMILQTGNQLILLATNFEPALLQLLLQLSDLQALNASGHAGHYDVQSKMRQVHFAEW